MIICEHRRTLFSEDADIRAFPPGTTIAEIVASFDTPLEFGTHGAVYFKRNGREQGDLVKRRNWRRIKPKSGASLFISVVPHEGGGGGNSSKQIFMLVAAIALIALTAWVGGGGLAFLAPSIFGGAGAHVAAAAIAVAGSAALSLLSHPSAGTPSAAAGVSADTQQLGVSGISQNTISAYNQVPAVRGIIRVSPPLLARPYTTINSNDEVLHLICGVVGPCDISSIKVNETDITDLPSGVITVETRQGFDSDLELTLIRECVFQENINVVMSQHRLQADQITLVSPASGSYPKAAIYRSARETDLFRLTLNFAGGLANFNDSSDVAVPFRIRIRRVGDSPDQWIKLPEIHINASRRDPFRQEIWLQWGQDADEAVLRAVQPSPPLFKRIYFKDPEWTANSYFDDGTAGATAVTTKHVYPGTDGMTFFLDEDTFPQGQYDVEITRGFSDAASNYTDSSYTSGLFTSRTVSGSIESIPTQANRSQSVAVENYASFRNEYPIATRGLALIAVEARNLQINSISAIFGSIVGGVVTNDPGALLRDVWTGSQNARPLDSSQIEDLTPLTTHCTAKGLTCNHVITEGSVDQASALIAACGDAILRRSDKFGVVIDMDRTAEAVTAFFQPGNMTGPLTVAKTFVTGARALVPSFNDQAQDYQSRELELPVFDDGVSSDEDTLTEAVAYDGLTTETLVTRRARLDLRRARMRTLKYTWETHLHHIRSKKGAMVGLQHDVLLNHIATGRVKSFVSSGSPPHLTSITLNTDILDQPAAGYASVWAVPNWWGLGSVWNLTNFPMGMQIQLEDGSVVTIPIASISGRTVTVSAAFDTPSGLHATSSTNGGSLVAIGPLASETRRVILTNVAPKDDFFASLEAVDEAPGIFTGF